MFPQPIVQEANRVNKMFQMENTNPCRLFHELITFYLSLLRRVTKISTVVVDSSRWTEIIAFETNQLPLSAVDCGIRFQMELENANLHAPAAENVKQRCKEYLLEFAKQMKQRLPTNMQQLQSLGALSPSTVLSVQKKPQLASL